MSLLDLTIHKAEQARLAEFRDECRRFFYIRKQKHRKSVSTLERECTYWNQWTRIGAGFYSEAWAHEAYPDYVMKVGGSASWGWAFLDTGEVGVADPWPIYAEYCRKVGGTHIPEVYHVEKPSKTSAMFWAVMPRYESFHRVDERYKTSEMNATVDSIFADKEKFPKWFDNAYKYVSAKSRVNVDIHMGNIMYDNVNHRAVVTDPFSSAGF